MDRMYRPRWPAVLAVAVPAGLILGTLGAGVTVLMRLAAGWSEVVEELPVMGPVLVVIGMVASALRVRSRRLTVLDDSLLVERDGLRITLSRRDLAEVRERGFAPVRVQEMVFRASDVQPPLTMDITGWRAARSRRLYPSLYVADWRRSPIGAA